MQDIYQQLQDLCNRQVETKKRMRPFGMLEKEVGDIQCISDSIVITIAKTTTDVSWSYHDLFSADSGFMETLEWKENKNDEDSIFPHMHYRNMCMMTATEKIDYILNNVL